MRLRALHSWELSPEEAINLQQQLRHRIELQPCRSSTIRLVAGIDVGFENKGRTTRAAVCVYDAGSLTLIESRLSKRQTTFPYIPGLLSFREIPAVLQTLESLQNTPDLLLVDGQGIAHPRRLGIASHLGLLTDLPAVGVGKSRLTGTHGPVPRQKGEFTPLMDGAEQIGCVLRTRENVKPVYVSPGHKIDFETAVGWVMKTVTRYKLPEPIRAADRLASKKAGERSKGKDKRE